MPKWGTILPPLDEDRAVAILDRRLVECFEPAFSSGPRSGEAEETLKNLPKDAGRVEFLQTVFKEGLAGCVSVSAQRFAGRLSEKSRKHKLGVFPLELTAQKLAGEKSPDADHSRRSMRDTGIALSALLRSAQGVDDPFCRDLRTEALRKIVEEGRWWQLGHDLAIGTTGLHDKPAYKARLGITRSLPLLSEQDMKDSSNKQLEATMKKLPDAARGYEIFATVLRSVAGATKSAFRFFLPNAQLIRSLAMKLLADFEETLPLAKEEERLAQLNGSQREVALLIRNARRQIFTGLGESLCAIPQNAHGGEFRTYLIEQAESCADDNSVASAGLFSIIGKSLTGLDGPKDWEIREVIRRLAENMRTVKPSHAQAILAGLVSGLAGVESDEKFRWFDELAPRVEAYGSVKEGALGPISPRALVEAINNSIVASIRCAQRK